MQKILILKFTIWKVVLIVEEFGIAINLFAVKVV